jgi:hypothetical protein
MKLLNYKVLISKSPLPQFMKVLTLIVKREGGAKRHLLF